MESPTPCGIITFKSDPNSLLISCCKIGDSENPPTKNKYCRSEGKANASFHQAQYLTTYKSVFEKKKF